MKKRKSYNKSANREASTGPANRLPVVSEFQVAEQNLSCAVLFFCQHTSAQTHNFTFSPYSESKVPPPSACCFSDSPIDFLLPSTANPPLFRPASPHIFSHVIDIPPHLSLAAVSFFFLQQTLPFPTVLLHSTLLARLLLSEKSKLISRSLRSRLISPSSQHQPHRWK